MWKHWVSMKLYETLIWTHHFSYLLGPWELIWPVPFRWFSGRAIQVQGPRAPGPDAEVAVEHSYAQLSKLCQAKVASCWWRVRPVTGETTPKQHKNNTKTTPLLGANGEFILETSTKKGGILLIFAAEVFISTCRVQTDWSPCQRFYLYEWRVWGYEGMAWYSIFRWS